jgi:formylglycine-generating enzyme required for sulfatase activity
MSGSSRARSFQMFFWGGLVLAWILHATLLDAPEPAEDPAALSKAGTPAPGPKTKAVKASQLKKVGGEDSTLPDDEADKAALHPPAPASTIPICATNQTFISGGSFLMGSHDGDEDESPEHRVTLSEYCIDKTEVTVAAYRVCVQAGACSPGHKTAQRSGYAFGHWSQWSRFCHWGQGAEMDQHPMNCVDWKQAASYCAWSGGRLPTEAEWEYAARGESRRRYPWGDQEPSPALVNACGDECVAMAKQQLGETWARTYKGNDGWSTTAPVGSFPKGASPFGILDMAGNVWEWTSDSYAHYTGDAVTNPRQSPTEAAPRICRGGGWSNFLPARVQATQRYWHLPDTRIGDLGFRCAR